jgi:hypothetical protein
LGHHALAVVQHLDDAIELAYGGRRSVRERGATLDSVLPVVVFGAAKDRYLGLGHALGGVARRDDCERVQGPDNWACINEPPAADRRFIDTSQQLP